MKTNVYIATLPRSGSTLLGMMLNQHSKCFNMGESFFWKKFVPGETKCSCGDKNCPLLLKVNKNVSQRKDIISFFDICKILDEFPQKKETDISKEIKREINEICSGLSYLADVFRGFTSRDIIVDTSTNIRIAESLLARNNWKIILLTRDPRGILYSYKKADVRYKINKPLSRKINVFIDFAKKTLSLINNPNVLFVRYEDICRYPEGELKRICSFLNIVFEHYMLDFKRDSGHTLMGNRMRFSDNRKISEDLDWELKLTRNEKKLITDSKELVALYKKIGYELI